MHGSMNENVEGSQDTSTIPGMMAFSESLEKGGNQQKDSHEIAPKGPILIGKELAAFGVFSLSLFLSLNMYCFSSTSPFSPALSWSVSHPLGLQSLSLSFPLCPL